MPWKTKYVDAELFVEHGGVRIYHCYRNDEVGQGVRTYWYSRIADASESGPNSFDVRELPEWQTSVGDGPTDELGRIRAAIVASIDNGSLVAGEVLDTIEEDPELFDALGPKLGSRVIADLVAVVHEREETAASAAELCEWATTSLDVDALWDRIGRIVDEIESEAQDHFGAAESR